MISVVYIPRTGSKFFSQQIAKQTGYEWLGEVLNPRTYPDEQNRNSTIESLNNSPDVVIKLGVWQSKMAHLQFILSLSEKVYFCVRSDFNQQLKSFYAATAPNVNNYHANIKHAEIVFDYDRYKKHAEWLKKQYNDTVKLLNDFEVETVFYESFATKQGKYHRNFTWTADPPSIEFDINKICQQNQQLTDLTKCLNRV